jgi:hypothetical protein
MSDWEVLAWVPVFLLMGPLIACSLVMVIVRHHEKSVRNHGMTKRNGVTL